MATYYHLHCYCSLLWLDYCSSFLLVFLCPTVFHTTSSLHFWAILSKWKSSHTLLYPESSSGSVSNRIPYNLFSTFLGDLTKVAVKSHTPLSRIFQRFCVQLNSIQPLLYIFGWSYQSGSQATHSFTQNLPAVLDNLGLHHLFYFLIH